MGGVVGMKVWPSKIITNPKDRKFGQWNRFDDKVKKVYPVYWYLKEMKDSVEVMWKRIKDIKYWFFYRFHPSHRYHVIRLNVKPNYYEVDDRLYLATMTLVKEFVEEEIKHNWRHIREYENKIWLYNDEHGLDETYYKIWYDAYQALKDAYNWHIKEKEEKEKELSNLWDSVPFHPFDQVYSKKEKQLIDKARKIETKIYDTSTKHCINIMKYRQYYWT